MISPLGFCISVEALLEGYIKLREERGSPVLAAAWLPLANRRASHRQLQFLRPAPKSVYAQSYEIPLDLRP